MSLICLPAEIFRLIVYNTYDPIDAISNIRKTCTFFYSKNIHYWLWILNLSNHVDTCLIDMRLLKMFSFSCNQILTYEYEYHVPRRICRSDLIRLDCDITVNYCKYFNRSFEPESCTCEMYPICQNIGCYDDEILYPFYHIKYGIDIVNGRRNILHESKVRNNYSVFFQNTELKPVSLNRLYIIMYNADIKEIIYEIRAKEKKGYKNYILRYPNVGESSYYLDGIICRYDGNFIRPINYVKEIENLSTHSKFRVYRDSHGDKHRKNGAGGDLFCLRMIYSHHYVILPGPYTGKIVKL